MPPLPIELCEHVINSAREDRATLLSCALTCHAWVPRSRYHLFYNAEIWGDGEINRLDRLRTAHPHLGALVQQLTVVHSYACDVLPLFPAALALALPRVTALRLRSCCAPPLALPAPTLRTLAHLRTVAHLHLAHLRFPTLADLARLVCAFPALAVLRCHALHTLSPPDAAALPPAPPHLAVLALDGALMEPLACWLLGGAARLAHLELCDLVGAGALQCAVRVVAAAGPALRGLTFGVAQPCTADAVREACARVDALLAQSRFAGVEVVLRGRTDGEWRAELRAWMPAASGRGILRVEEL